jgi:hypothetical protein
MKNKKYHTVGNPVPKTIPHCWKSSSKKNTTLSEIQFQKKYHTVGNPVPKSYQKIVETVTNIYEIC